MKIYTKPKIEVHEIKMESHLAATSVVYYTGSIQDTEPNEVKKQNEFWW